MHRTLLALVPLIGLASGCGVDCGDPEQVDGTYDFFHIVRQARLDPEEGFQHFSTPVNGWGEWLLDWHGPNGPVSILIDGQPYEARAEWSPVECGRFSLEFAGTYTFVHEFRDGSTVEGTHDFETDMELQSYGHQIEGTWETNETWVNFAGETGTFRGEGLVSAVRDDN